MNEEESDIEEKESERIKILVNKWTSLLNESDINYKKEMWDNGEGYSIICNHNDDTYSTSIDFYLSGRIEFNLEENKDDTRK